MIGLTENDFGLLLFATLSKKGIMEINKPLIQKKLFKFINEPVFKPLFQGIFVRRDEYNKNEGYIELSRAFSYCHLNGIITIKSDKKNGINVYSLLLEQSANNIINVINKKYGHEYSILMDNMIDFINLDNTTYVDSESKLNNNSLIMKSAN